MFSLTKGAKYWFLKGRSIFLGTMNVSRKRIVEIRPLENKNKHSTSREQSGNIWFPLTTGTKDWICEGTSVFLGTMHASLIENVEIRRLKGGSKFRSDGDRRGGGEVEIFTSSSWSKIFPTYTHIPLYLIHFSSLLSFLNSSNTLTQSNTHTLTHYSTLYPPLL